MANLITELDGAKAYIGLLSSEEISEANKLLEHLQDVIPKIEKDLLEKYPNEKGRIYFAHEFGTELRRLVKENNVKGYQKKIFWDQIRKFASLSEAIPKDRSENRYIYGYYYKLSEYPLQDIENINWSEWSQVLDTPSLVKEERFIDWLVAKSKKYKIKREEFRELMTGARIYIKDKDLAVYNDIQLYERLNMVYKISINRLTLYNDYFTKMNKKPTAARIKKTQKYKNKYYEETFNFIKLNKNIDIDEACNLVFKKVYNTWLDKNLDVISLGIIEIFAYEKGDFSQTRILEILKLNHDKSFNAITNLLVNIYKDYDDKTHSRKPVEVMYLNTTLKSR